MARISDAQTWRRTTAFRFIKTTLIIALFAGLTASVLAEAKSSNQKSSEANQAMADYNHSIALNVNDAMLYYDRGKLWEQLGNDVAALKDINQAIEFDPNIAKFYLARAFLEHKQGKSVLVKQDIAHAQFADPLLAKDIQFIPSDQNEDRYLRDRQLTDVHNAGAVKSTEKTQVGAPKSGTVL